MNQVEKYMEAFRRGYLGDVETEGLLGRVIRGKAPEDFETLSDDPDRRIVLLTDPLGLESIIGKPAFQILIAIGWEPGYAVQKITDGFRMKLAVFREGGPARLATWDGMMAVVCLAYPAIAKKIAKWLTELKRSKFNDLELAYGCDMSEVDRTGKSDRRFMTAERYADAADNLANARAFLYFTVHLREQYMGDGYTYDNKGNRGVKEYIAPNCRLEDLLDAETIDLAPELPAACTVKPRRTTGMGDLIPGYYRPEDVGKRYAPRFDLVTEEAKAVADRVPKSSKDRTRRMLVLIDNQDSFAIPEIKNPDGEALQAAGELLVTGAVDDIRRVIEMIYRSPDWFSSVLTTQDKHIPYQIFFPTWWRSRAGKMADPFTLITEEAVANGDFRPVIEKAWSLDYVKKLKAMMVWPFHCMTGTPGSELVPALAEAIHWLAIVRGIQPMTLFKGTVPQTEHYGPFCPCVEVAKHPQGSLNTILLDQIAAHDEVAFAGEAEDFCVREGMKQVLKYFGQNHPDALKKAKFLSDCTSMVFPQNRAEADNFLDDMVRQGVSVTTSDKLVG